MWWHFEASSDLLLRSQSTLSTSIKMLKNLTVLLYTYFHNISLNVLRPTFFNICNLPFLLSPNIGIIRVKVGPKTIFPIFWASAPRELQVFFHWYEANQKTNKIFFELFSCKIRFQSSSYCNKKWITHWKKAGTVLCSSLLEICMQSLKLILSHFRTRARQMFTTQKLLPREIPL